jgi:peroxiredoxin
LKIWVGIYAAIAAAFIAAAIAMIRPSVRADSHAGRSGGGHQPIERFDLIEIVNSARPIRIGVAFPDFEARDEIGAPFRLTSHLDRPLLFGAFCTCTRCRETAGRWTDLLRRHPAEFTAAALVALPRGDQLFEFHDGLGINFPLIPDPDHRLSARYPGPGSGYAALGCPRAWVIGTDGRCRYVMPMNAAPTEATLAAITRALHLAEHPHPGVSSAITPAS